MMHKTRFVLMVAATVAGMSLAGCSGGSSAEPTTGQSSNALAGFDPCAALQPEQIESLGADPQGKPVDDTVGKGCEFRTENYLFVIYKGEEDSLEYWESQKDRFAVFEPNQVGARRGIKMITTASSGTGGLCMQAIDASPGSVTVQVNVDGDKIKTPEATCSQAMEIAKAVETKLPK